MEPIIAVFVISLIVFFFSHLVFFFNLNEKNRPILNAINVLVLVIYVFFLIVFFLEKKIGILVTDHYNFLLLGGIFLLLFVIKDYFSGTKSLGLLFAVVIMMLAFMGLVNAYFKDEIHSIGYTDSENMFVQAQILIDQFSVIVFGFAMLYSIAYHYALREIKNHQTFFFSNRFPSFQRLKFWIDLYLIGGCLGTGVSLLFGFEVSNIQLMQGESGDWEILHRQFLNIFILIYFLLLIYIRYRHWFSSKLNLYWMLLSIGLFATKVVYW